MSLSVCSLYYPHSWGVRAPAALLSTPHEWVWGSSSPFATNVGTSRIFLHTSRGCACVREGSANAGALTPHEWGSCNTDKLRGVAR
jgi:hypothetical protein